MTIYSIENDTNSITAFANAQQAAEACTTPFDVFTNQSELTDLVAGWPADRLLATYNSLPGVKPLKKLKDAKDAAGKIWERVEKLGQLVTAAPEAAKPQAEAAKPEAAPPKPKGKGKGGVQAPSVAPAKGKATKKAAPAKPAAKGKKTTKEQEASAPRGGSKMAEVIAMMQRKNGASITEIMEAMGWQRHTVRGFVAGALKKAGHTVESFKPEGGERSYRISK